MSADLDLGVMWCDGEMLRMPRATMKKLGIREHQNVGWETAALAMSLSISAVRGAMENAQGVDPAERAVFDAIMDEIEVTIAKDLPDPGDPA